MLELKNAREEKADQIIYLLDLFEGKLSYNDIMTCDIPILNQLQDAKIRRLEERIKNEKEKEQNNNTKKKGG